MAVFHGIREPFTFHTYPIPAPVAGAVVLKMRLANICGSDLHYWRGDADLVGRGFEMPYALGHEGVGEIFRLGTGVTTDSAGQPVREGDRVVFRYFDPCGRCAVCLGDHPYACPYRQRQRLRGVRHWPHFRGTFAQYYYLYPGHTMFRVPDGLSDASVASVNCALAQVISGLDRAQVRPGESVAIQGAGGLGLYAAAVAKARGAGPVIAIDGIPERLRLARAFGADATIDLNQADSPESRVQAVRDLTDGLGADVTLELVGHPGVVAEGVEMTAPGGRFVEIGNINVGWAGTFDPSTAVMRSVTLIGVAHYRARDLAGALAFVARESGRLPLDRMLASRFDLTDINDAFVQQDAGRVTRSALVPHPAEAA